MVALSPDGNRRVWEPAATDDAIVVLDREWSTFIDPSGGKHPARRTVFRV